MEECVAEVLNSTGFIRFCDLAEQHARLTGNPIGFSCLRMSFPNMAQNDKFSRFHKVLRIRFLVVRNVVLLIVFKVSRKLDIRFAFYWKPDSFLILFC